MSKKIKFLGFKSSTVEALTRSNLMSCKDVLNKSNFELMLQLKISIQSANDVIYKASRACAPIPTNALKMFTEAKLSKSCIKTTLNVLDDLLSGGLKNATITEIAGPPGCGKTQFCLMLAVVFATSVESDDRSVLYIDTEGAFDPSRLLEIASSKYPDRYQTNESLSLMASRIHVYREKNLQGLSSRLDNLEEDIIMHRAGLVVIDSVASLVRKEYDSRIPGNISERNKLLSRHASVLKFFASSYNFPVIITNQITTQFRKNVVDIHMNEAKFSSTYNVLGDAQTSNTNYNRGDSNTIIALGAHWSHCVNTRIILQYSTTHSDLKELHLVKSSHAPHVQLHYTIEASGIAANNYRDFSDKRNISMNLNTKAGLFL